MVLLFLWFTGFAYDGKIKIGNRNRGGYDAYKRGKRTIIKTNTVVSHAEWDERAQVCGGHPHEQCHLCENTKKGK